MGSGEANRQPETRESADHSLPFVMAVALMEGNVEIRHYDQMYYKRADVRALMQKITVRIGEEPVAAWPEVPLNIVDIEMKLRQSALDESGLPSRPFQPVDDRRRTGAEISSAGGAAASREANQRSPGLPAPLGRSRADRRTDFLNGGAESIRVMPTR